MKTSSRLPVDQNYEAIQAGSVIAIDNITINSSTYVAIALPSNVSCKSVTLKTRSGAAFYLATSASPTSYVTVDGVLTLSLVANAGETIGYAKGAAADVLEAIYLD